MTRADRNKGFVWGVDGQNMIIALHRGGKLVAPRSGKFTTGDRVAVIFDPTERHVIEVRPMSEVEIAIRCGSDPIFEAAIRAPEDLPLTEEEVVNGDICAEPSDVFGCGG